MDKETILRNYYKSQGLIEVGDYVVVTDGSYMLTTNYINGLIHDTKGLSDEIFVVIMVNQPCPTYYDYVPLDTLSYSNNCIIRSLVDNEISFCSLINLSVIDITESDFGEFDENNISRELIRESNLDKVLGE